MMFDFDAYEEALDSPYFDGQDPLTDDAHDDNHLMLLLANMSDEQKRRYTATTDVDTDMDDRIKAAYAALQRPQTTLDDMFERLVDGGFIDEITWYRLLV